MPMTAFEDYQVKATPDHEFVCSTWFERDRAHVRLETPQGRLVFDLWDDDVWQAIEDGYLSRPNAPRPTDSDWQPCAVEYARAQGLLESGAARRAAQAVCQADRAESGPSALPRPRARG